LIAIESLFAVLDENSAVFVVVNVEANVPLDAKFVKVPAAGDEPPMTVPSIVPPLISAVVTEPKFVHVAVAAVGDPVMVGEVNDLLVKV